MNVQYVGCFFVGRVTPHGEDYAGSVTRPTEESENMKEKARSNP